MFVILDVGELSWQVSGIRESDPVFLTAKIERAIIMLYLEDKSYDEMEEILGINQNNLRVKMNRIKEKLRKLTKVVEHGVG